MEYVLLGIAVFFSIYVVSKCIQYECRQSPCNSFSPAMMGVSYDTVLPGGHRVAIKVEKMSVRDQRIEDTVFSLFKEVVLSKVNVTINGGDTAEILNWATMENLAPLAAYMLPELLDQNRIYLAGTKILLEDMEVSLYSGEKPDRETWLVADSLSVGALSDTAVFTGRLDLRFKPSEHVCSSTGGIWSPSESAIRFPTGYSHNGRLENEGTFTISNRENGNIKMAQLREAMPEASFESGNPPSSNQLLQGGPKQRLIAGKEFYNNISHLKKEQIGNFVWQFLALNPGILQQQRITPFQILMPNFKVGAFDPGPFFGSNPN